VSYAIVGWIDQNGVLITDDGDNPTMFVVEDKDLGVLVDVVKMPAMEHCRARLGTGFAHNKRCKKGSPTIKVPIRGGDEVLIEQPGGSANYLPVITRRLHNTQAEPQKPWNNDCILISLGDYPVTLVNEKGMVLTVDRSGVVNYRNSTITLNLGSDGTFSIKDKKDNEISSNGKDIHIFADTIYAGNIMRVGVSGGQALVMAGGELGPGLEKALKDVALDLLTSEPAISAALSSLAGKIDDASTQFLFSG